MSQSTYEDLGKLDTKLRDKVMEQLGINREMLDSNISIEEYLRQTGKTDQLLVLEANKSQRLASQDVTVSHFMNAGYIAPSIESIVKSPIDIVSPIISQSNQRFTYQFNSFLINSSESKDLYKVISDAHKQFGKNLIASEIFITPDKQEINFTTLLGNTNDRTGLNGISKLKDWAINHPVTDAFSQVVIGPLGSTFTDMYSSVMGKKFITEIENNIQNSYMNYCRPDLKIAAEYRRKNINPDGSKKNKNSSLTPAENAAFENLWMTMEANGGSKLLVRKVEDDLSITANTFTMLGKTGINVALRLLRSDDAIPTLEQLSNAIKGVNIGGGAIALLTVLFPPATRATLGGLAAANVALYKVLAKVEEWHADYDNTEKRSEFLFDIGRFAQQQIDAHSSIFSDDKLRFDLQIEAENSASRLAKGPKLHDTEDVRTLLRYKNNSAYWMSEKIKADDPNKIFYQSRQHAMEAFIVNGHIAENKNMLMAVSKEALRQI